MKNNLIFLLFLFVFPTFAAGGGGSWYMQTQGVILRHTSKIYRSQPLITDMAAAQHGKLSSVHWQYQSPHPLPPNLVATLCQNNRCITLPTPSGTTYAFKGMNAADPFYFTYEIKGQDILNKPIYITANSIIVNYAIQMEANKNNIAAQ